MSEAKFTKGEWELYAIDRDMRVIGGVHIVALDQYPCAFIPSWSDSKETEIEAIANAHLIAAAPEMYRKLEHVAEFFDNLCEDDAANEIKALLAKSRGEHDNN